MGAEVVLVGRVEFRGEKGEREVRKGKCSGKESLVVRSGRISDGVMPYTANGLNSLRPVGGWVWVLGETTDWDVHILCLSYIALALH